MRWSELKYKPLKAQTITDDTPLVLWSEDFQEFRSPTRDEDEEKWRPTRFDDVYEVERLKK